VVAELFASLAGQHRVGVYPVVAGPAHGQDLAQEAGVAAAGAGERLVEIVREAGTGRDDGVRLVLGALQLQALQAADGVRELRPGLASLVAQLYDLGELAADPGEVLTLGTG
jgi:hypothetical protein